MCTACGTVWAKAKEREKNDRRGVTQSSPCSKENRSWGMFVSLPFLCLQRKQAQAKLNLWSVFHSEFHQVASRTLHSRCGRGLRNPRCVFYFHWTDVFKQRGRFVLSVCNAHLCLPGSMSHPSPRLASRNQRENTEGK